MRAVAVLERWQCKCGEGVMSVYRSVTWDAWLTVTAVTAVTSRSVTWGTWLAVAQSLVGVLPHLVRESKRYWTQSGAELRVRYGSNLS